MATSKQSRPSKIPRTGMYTVFYATKGEPTYASCFGSYADEAEARQKAEGVLSGGARSDVACAWISTPMVEFQHEVSPIVEIEVKR